MIRRFLVAGTLSFLILACEKAPPNGRIRVRNDSQDSSYNIIQVSGGGVYKSLKPSESVILPSGTTSITLSRAYKDYTRRYEIECPPLGKNESGITIKMIDAHLNRMPGGCNTVNASKE